MLQLKLCSETFAAAWKSLNLIKLEACEGEEEKLYLEQCTMWFVQNVDSRFSH